MKIDRLLGILTILMQEEKVTAPYLAERFEVSRRTIQRDVQTISQAGIPIITAQGGDGGISIMDGYRLDKSILKKEELEQIITGLRSVSSVMATAQINSLINKLSPQGETFLSTQGNLMINLSSHYKESLSGKITLIQEGIKIGRCLSFIYFSDRGQHQRLVEPAYISYSWSAWYLIAYCREREAFRMFKLQRLWEMSLSEEPFFARELPEDIADVDRFLPDKYHVVVSFDASILYLIIETYGPGCYWVEPDGTHMARLHYTNERFILSWILGFGDSVRIMEPEPLVRRMQELIGHMDSIYKNNEKNPWKSPGNS